MPTIRQLTAMFRAIRHGWDFKYLDGTDVVLVRAALRIAIGLDGRGRRCQ